MRRAARFCYGAAHGGQIMVPLHIAQDLVQFWTGQDLQLQVSCMPAPPSTRLLKVQVQAANGWTLSAWLSWSAVDQLKRGPCTTELEPVLHTDVHAHQYMRSHASRSIHSAACTPLRSCSHDQRCAQDDIRSPTRQLSASSAGESTFSATSRVLQPAGHSPDDRPKSRGGSFTGQEGAEPSMQRSKSNKLVLPASPTSASGPPSPFTQLSQRPLPQVCTLALVCVCVCGLGGEGAGAALRHISLQTGPGRSSAWHVTCAQLASC